MLESDDIMDVFLQPGELYFGGQDTRMRTLLGSCLSICMWHPRRRIGGMSHCLLPTDLKGGDDRDADPRFVDEAIMILLREALTAGTDPAEYQIKLFGGADMFLGIDRTDRMRIGEKNVDKARRILRALGLQVSAEDVRGDRHRTLVFELASGDVWVSRGNPVNAAQDETGVPA